MICKNNFKPHLSLAHDYWQKVVERNDIVVDATCGNGHDTLFLAQLAYEGKVHSIDIQKEALSLAKEKIASEQNTADVHFYNQCHSVFPKKIEPGSVKLIVYNLGYLPGGDKSITTMLNSTLESLNSALSLLRPDGLISVTCYPGHDEGLREESAIMEFIKNLSPKKWHCHYHTWPNRPRHPSLLIITPL